MPILAHLGCEVRVTTCAQGAESNFIGAGIYPTLAMFNHSCDPSIVRFYVEDVVAVQESVLLVCRTRDIRTALYVLKSHVTTCAGH